MEDAPGTLDGFAARLRERLQGEADVVVAYLFGSQARGDSGPLSTSTWRCWLDGEATGRRELELRAVVEAAAATDAGRSAGGGPPRVDLVILNDAPVSLAYRVWAQGMLLLLSRDERARVTHWVATVDRYLDMAPLRTMLAEGLGHRLEEGRFGRS